jgi:hypothetical protein
MLAAIARAQTELSNLFVVILISSFFQTYICLFIILPQNVLIVNLFHQNAKKYPLTRPPGTYEGIALINVS